MEEIDYEERFKSIPVDQKREDLLVHPLVNHELIKQATDEQVEAVYFEVFSSMDSAMREITGYSMFDDEDDHFED